MGEERQGKRRDEEQDHPLQTSAVRSLEEQRRKEGGGTQENRVSRVEESGQVESSHSSQDKLKSGRIVWVCTIFPKIYLSIYHNIQ